VGNGVEGGEREPVVAEPVFGDGAVAHHGRDLDCLLLGQAEGVPGDIEDEAFALVNALDATQQKAAVLGSSPIDLVLGPGQGGKTIQAEGLPAAQMTA